LDRLINTKSTDDVAKHRQVEYWNEVVSDTFTSLEVNPSQPSQFDARLDKAQLARIGISQVNSSASRVCHSKSQISRETTPLFLLHLQLQGNSVNRQDGREAVLSECGLSVTEFEEKHPASIMAETIGRSLILISDRLKFL
jgi:hypothetical protein